MIFAVKNRIMKYLFIALMFVSTSVFGQASKSQTILNQLSGKIKGLNTFYIEFNATVKNPNGLVESEIGKGWVKGNKFSAIYGDITLLSNGFKQWTVVKEDKSVYETNADDSDEMINPKKLMTIWEKGFNNAYEKEVTESGEKLALIRLVPKDPGKAEYHSIYVYVNATKNELRKAVVKMKNGSTMTYILTKFTENPEIEDAKFVYNAKKYPGYELVRD